MIRPLFPIVLTVSLVATPYVGMTQTIEQLFQQGEQAYNEGKYREAERIFRQIITIESGNTRGYNSMGVVLEKQGRLEEAIAAYKKAIEIDPNYALPYYNMGVVLEKQGNLEEAITAYKKAIEIDPNYAVAYNNIGIVLEKQGKLEEAIAAYKKAIEIDPNYALPYYNMGIALYDLGKLEEAIAAYKKAIEIDPNYALPYHNMGYVLEKQGKLEEAISAYKKGIEIDPNLAYAYYNLGYALEKQGKSQEAVDAYKKAIDLEPNYALPQHQNNFKETKRLLARKNDPPPPNLDDRDYLPTKTQEPLVKQLRSTVRIIATTFGGLEIGTGWVIRRQGNTVLIVTNRHVISDRDSKRPSNTIEVEFYSTLNDNQRPRYKAEIEKITGTRENVDLAVLKVKGIPDDIEPLTVKSGWVQRNLEITIIGHPVNVDIPWSAVKGKVMNYDPNNPFIFLDALVDNGNSGGPVLNEAGEVIAMIVEYKNKNNRVFIDYRGARMAFENTSSIRKVGLAYPIEIVINKLQEWGILSN